MEENKVIDSRFEFAQKDKVLRDEKMKTKRVGFFADAMSRFAKNKGSIVAAAILGTMILFSLIAPLCTGFGENQRDDYYTQCMPKISKNANGFWDGCKNRSITENEYYWRKEQGSIKKESEPYQKGDMFMGYSNYYDVKIDTYKVGFVYDTFELSKIEEILEHDKTVEQKDRILWPLVDMGQTAGSWINEIYPTATSNQIDSYKGAIRTTLGHNANIDYRIYANGSAVKDASGKITYLFKEVSSGDFKTESFDINGDGTTETYIIAEKSPEASMWDVRIQYDNYYKYTHNGKAPVFILGSDTVGRDLLTRLACGARLSLLLGFSVSAINLILGLIYGAIAGYYGGTTDLVMERIAEILSEVPFMIVMSLFSIYNSRYWQLPVVIVVFFAFILTGWLGTSGTVRMQFYRYKNQEYVLAARTLGANDFRLIFRHILPNAVGTIVTSSVLMIPGVIFSETSLSYLGIIDFASTGTASIGVMLSEGQSSYTTNPNLIIWPAIFISILMICFNLFGNGLRDAFNPQLRGANNG